MVHPPKLEWRLATWRLADGRLSCAGRDLVVDALNTIPGISCHRPEGAFYVYPNIAGCLGRVTAGGKTLEVVGRGSKRAIGRAARGLPRRSVALALQR